MGIQFRSVSSGFGPNLCYNNIRDETDCRWNQSGTEEKPINLQVAGFLNTYPGNTEWTFKLRNLAESHISCHKELQNRFRNIHILAAAGLLILVSALFNHLVLFIGQQQRKQKLKIAYIGMRASQSSLFCKSAIELLSLVLVAFLCSLCLIETLFPFYEQYTAITQFQKAQNGDITHLISKNNLIVHTLYFIGYSLLIFLLASLPVLYRFTVLSVGINTVPTTLLHEIFR